MADKAAFRIIFSMAASENLKIEHFDITSPHNHEAAYPSFPLYVKKLPPFDGKLLHPACTQGLLKMNHYDHKRASKIYSDGLHKHLLSLSFQQFPFKPCLYLKPSTSELPQITLVVCGDDFLTVSKEKSTLDWFLSIYAAKVLYRTFRPTLLLFIMEYQVLPKREHPNLQTSAHRVHNYQIQNGDI